MPTRRRLLQGSLAVAGLQAMHPLLAQSQRPLDLLVLGGTGFLGPHVIDDALSRGHRVTMFNRGKSAAPRYDGRVDLLIGNRDANIAPGLEALQGERRWDAVIDLSGYVPRHVRDSATLLEGRVGRYLFVSTVAVYDPQGGPDFTESSPLQPPPDPPTEEVTGRTYGALKAECERVLIGLYGAAATIVRPTFVFGPGDDTDRFTYWIVQMANGGTVLGPSLPDLPLQWVDARDLCPWMVRLVERNVPGTFNAAGPTRPPSWREVLATLAPLSPAPARVVFATPELLTELNLALPLAAANRKPRYFASAAAVSAALSYRPLDDTAKATLSWWNALPAERRAAPDGWPSVDVVAQALERLER